MYGTKYLVSSQLLRILIPLEGKIPCVGLAGNENLSPVQGKGVYEVLPKAKELSCDIRLASSCWCPLSKARPNRLLDPNHIGKI